MRAWREPLCAVGIATLALCAGVSRAGGESRDGWWNPAWEYRLWFECPQVRTGFPGADVCVVEFLAGGRLKADASDLRVVSGGAPVPHRVLEKRTSDDLCRVAFELRGERRAAVYMGNERARRPEQALEIRRGCLLETFEYRGGSPGSLAGMQEVLKLAEGAPQGADFVPNVFFGHNPFGSSERFVSRFTGWLVCPETGTYIFCTSSDDASFLLVDGAPVVDWPGWHGAVADARFQARKALEKGLHKLEYLHVNGGGDTIAVAAWQKPSDDRVAPIPPGAFAPVARGSFLRAERLGGGPAPHFEAELAGECFFEDRVAVRVVFRDRSGDAPQDRRQRWDFGDGLSGSGSSCEHVYLREGTYRTRLELTLGARQESVTNRLRVERLWKNQTSPSPEPIRRHAEIVRTYDFSRMAGSDLEAAAVLFKAAGMPADEELVLRAIVARPAEVEERAYFEAVLFLVKRWREDARTRAAAARLLDQAESHLSANPNLVARVIRERGDLLFYYVGDLEGALGEYDKVVGRFAGKLEDHIVRITKIRLGDVFRKKGDYDRALAAYRDAERFRIHGIQGEPEVRRGVLAQAAEAAIARGDVEEARAALDALEWEFPAEKLLGQTSLLRARAAMLEKNTAEALVQLDDLVNVNPRANSAPEALFMAAEIERSLGRTAEAVRRYERIAKEYPDSPRASDARTRLGAIRKTP